MSDSYDDYEAKIYLAEHAWEKRVVHAVNMKQERVDEMVKTEHDKQIEIAQAYERGWNAALAQQEPVAWVSSLDFDDDDQEIIPAKDKGKLGTNNCDIPLYTTPKQWVGLTDEEVSEVIDNVLEGSDWLDVARALEAAIKEKNT
jgi:hypothetical protein